MSYNWKDASTPQGRDRLKELMESNVAVISMSGDGELSESFIEPDGTIVINHGSYEDWQDVDEMDVLFGLEFLDPFSPSPEPVADENGLLPCPFCGENGRYEVFDETCNSVVHDIECGIQCQGCYVSVEIEVDRKKNTREDAKELAAKAWNTRAGKEVNP